MKGVAFGPQAARTARAENPAMAAHADPARRAWGLRHDGSIAGNQETGRVVRATRLMLWLLSGGRRQACPTGSRQRTGLVGYGTRSHRTGRLPSRARSQQCAAGLDGTPRRRAPGGTAAAPRAHAPAGRPAPAGEGTATSHGW